MPPSEGKARCGALGARWARRRERPRGIGWRCPEGRTGGAWRTRPPAGPTRGPFLSLRCRSMRTHYRAKNSTSSETQTEATSRSCRATARNAGPWRVSRHHFLFLKNYLRTDCHRRHTGCGGDICPPTSTPRIPTRPSAGCTRHPGGPPRGPPAARTASGVPHCSPRQGGRSSKLPCPEPTPQGPAVRSPSRQRPATQTYLLGLQRCPGERPPTLQHLATDPRHGPRVATRKQKPRPASEANAPCAPRGTSCPQGLAPAQPRHTCVRFQLGRGRVVSLQTGMLLGRGRDTGAKAGPGRPRRPGRPPPRGARNRADGQLGPQAACWRFRPARHRPATDFTTRHTLGVTSPTAASPENKRMP